MNLVVYPNAKINLGLHVLRKRPDGFHDLETLFVPHPLKDILEIAESDSLYIKYYGLEYSINSLEDELCIRAYSLLKKDFDLPPVSIHLYKAIPIGAGLGGGSSDAAFMLNGLNTMFSLGLSKEELAVYASKIGSDCPFFIYNTPLFGEGKGEILSPFDAPCVEELFGKEPKYTIRLVTPSISVSTSEAYRDLEIPYRTTSLKEALSSPIETWKENVVNDFEKTVLKKYPQLSLEKENLYKQGAIYASLSGSGSSLFGIFAI